MFRPMARTLVGVSHALETLRLVESRKLSNSACFNYSFSVNAGTDVMLVFVRLLPCFPGSSFFALRPTNFRLDEAGVFLVLLKYKQREKKEWKLNTFLVESFCEDSTNILNQIDGIKQLFRFFYSFQRIVWHLLYLACRHSPVPALLLHLMKLHKLTLWYVVVPPDTHSDLPWQPDYEAGCLFCWGKHWRS